MTEVSCGAVHAAGSICWSATLSLECQLNRHTSPHTARALRPHSAAQPRRCMSTACKTTKTQRHLIVVHSCACTLPTDGLTAKIGCLLFRWLEFAVREHSLTTCSAHSRVRHLFILYHKYLLAAKHLLMLCVRTMTDIALQAMNQTSAALQDSRASLMQALPSSTFERYISTVATR